MYKSQETVKTTSPHHTNQTKQFHHNLSHMPLMSKIYKKMYKQNSVQYIQFEMKLIMSANYVDSLLG